MWQLLGLRGPWLDQVCRDINCLCCGSYGSTRVSLQASCSWQSESLFHRSFSIAPPVQALRGSLTWGPSLLFGVSGPLAGVLLCSSVHQAFSGPTSLLFSCRHWRVGRERLWWWLYPLCMTQQYHLASIALWLSSTVISHHDLLPHIPLTCPSTINSCPGPRIAPQSLNSSSQLLHLLGNLHPWPGYVWLRQWVYMILIRFRLPQISCFTLSRKCFSSDSDNYPDVMIRPRLQFPTHQGRSSPSNTPVFPRTSFILLSFAWFYIFFSVGQVFLSALAHVLHTLLCLKVYSWCICGEKCTPRPPTPPPSCSLLFYY